VKGDPQLIYDSLHGMDERLWTLVLNAVGHLKKPFERGCRRLEGRSSGENVTHSSDTAESGRVTRWTGLKPSHRR
jgi:hypothetical protein